MDVMLDVHALPCLMRPELMPEGLATVCTTPRTIFTFWFFLRPQTPSTDLCCSLNLHLMIA